jgi:hypothetical protein
MANIKKVQKPVSMSVYIDKVVLDKLREQEPYFNLSSLIQETMREKLHQQKKAEALKIDPINLRAMTLSQDTSMDDKNNISKLTFEDCAKRDLRPMIWKYAHSLQDPIERHHFIKNAQAMSKVFLKVK